MKFVVDPSRRETFHKTFGDKHEVAAIEVPVKGIERIWSGMPHCYIDAGDTKDAKYLRVSRWLQQNDEVWMPLLGIWKWNSGSFKFHDGRHTFAALRDLGYQQITIGVPVASVEFAHNLLSDD